MSERPGKILLTIGEIPAPSTPPFSANSGPQIPLQRDATALEYLQLFFNASIWMYLVQQTNAYAHHRMSNARPSRRSLFRKWVDVTVAEMKAFVGLILSMGLVQIPEVREYWSRHETLNFPFFRRVLSRDRFLQIFWSLHVGEINGPTRRSKIQSFIDLLLPLFQRFFTPSKSVSIDEAMIAFRGRVRFRQYIRGKPTPWGIKAYVLSDSDTGYLYSVVIYYGSETELINRPDLNHTTKVVLTLMEPIANMGYDLYTDRFYTSPTLALELAAIKTTLTGTAMANRKEMPQALKQKRKRKKGEVNTYHKGKMVVMEWTDKRTLITLTTKYSNKMVDVPTR